MRVALERQVGQEQEGLSVDDGNGETDTDEVVIEVVDTTPPELSFSMGVTEIWPPNHKMVTVASGISATDACDDSPTLTIEVGSNEPAFDIRFRD